MLATTTGVRVLSPADLPALSDLVRHHPLVNLFVDHRLETTRLEPQWLGGQMWGYYEDGHLVSACHVAANLVPIEATSAAVAAFADRALTSSRTCSSIIGPRDPVQALWERLEPHWGPARSPRLNQPFLQIGRSSPVRPDPRVRRVMLDELEVLYPASVAMFTEEVGESPEVPERQNYRARVMQLISRGWAFAIIENGEVLFKAEVGAATAHGTQVQGVWVRPDRRGEGIAAGAMAAVVDQVLEDIAPVVTLYVNDHNLAARRTYERVGFEQTATFASVLF